MFVGRHASTYMCVCMSINTYIRHMYVYTHIWMDGYLYECMYLCIFVCRQTFIHVCTNTHYTYMHAKIHIYVNMHIYTCLKADMHQHTCVYVCT